MHAVPLLVHMLMMLHPRLCGQTALQACPGPSAQISIVLMPVLLVTYCVLMMMPVCHCTSGSTVLLVTQSQHGQSLATDTTARKHVHLLSGQCRTMVPSRMLTLQNSTIYAAMPSDIHHASQLRMQH